LLARVGQAGDMSLPLVTVGHGTAGQDEFTALLSRAGIASLVDVRTAPGSRRNPHMGRLALGDWLPAAGIDYRWEPRLGGFRKTAADSPDVFWRNDAFRGFAGHTRDPDFAAAIDELLAGAREQATTVMCSESVWWRCHRRIIADFVQLARGVGVEHLMHDGRRTPHPVSPGARLRDDGLLVYDVGTIS
jgi:uncharacterized protein (DUF488 family)